MLDIGFSVLEVAPSDFFIWLYFQAPPTSKAAPARPPMTPPAIAPVLPMLLPCAPPPPVSAEVFLEQEPVALPHAPFVHVTFSDPEGE